MNKSDRRKETEEALGRSDYFEYWLEQATQLAAEKGFPSHFIVEALGIVKSAFGEEWIKKRISEIVIKEEIRKQVQDVPRWISVPGAPQVSSLLELAIYLKCMFNVPGFPRVLEMLKDPTTFNSAFLQLAYGYRFFKLLATNVQFEPPVDSGRIADILLNWGSTDIVCECYSPMATGRQGYMDFMSYNADKVLKSAGALRKRVTILVRLVEGFPGDQESRATLQNDCIQLLRDVNFGSHLNVTSKWGELEVWELSHINPIEEQKLHSDLAPHVTCGLSNSLVAKKDLRAVVKGKSVNRTPKSNFLMALRPVEFAWEDVVEDLASKIESKIAQLRMNEISPKGLLIVETPYAAFVGLDEPDKKKHLHRIQKKLEPHKNVSGLILVHRTWTEKNRYMYAGYSVKVGNDSQVAELFDQLTELENRQNIIDTE